VQKLTFLRQHPSDHSDNLNTQGGKADGYDQRRQPEKKALCAEVGPHLSEIGRLKPGTCGQFNRMTKAKKAGGRRIHERFWGFSLSGSQEIRPRHGEGLFSEPFNGALSIIRRIVALQQALARFTRLTTCLDANSREAVYQDSAEALREGTRDHLAVLEDSSTARRDLLIRKDLSNKLMGALTASSTRRLLARNESLEQWFWN
jgi:hypothetical protein